MEAPMRVLFVLTVLATAACAAENHDVPAAAPPGVASATLHSSINPAASFDSYRTFSFGSSGGPAAGYTTSARCAEVQRRLRPVILAALTQKGYVPATGSGDLTVLFGSGAREVGSPIVEGWMPDDESADFVDGSLVVDAFDAAEGHLVWHGASRARLDPDRVDDDRIQRSVQELLSSFPPATGASP